MFKHLDGQNISELRNFKLNPVATDPTTPVKAVPWFNTTSNQIKIYDGTVVQTIATLSDLSAIARYRGSWDASTGIPTAAGSILLPGSPIEAGDYWRVSVGGNIANLIGADLLAAGDLIFADADLASTAAQFFGVQSNADLSVATIFDSASLATLAANTATDAVPTLLAGGKIGHYMILDAAGKDITALLDVFVNQVVPKITISSLVALSNLNISFVGTKSSGL
jgi:hypothetical protein